MEKDSRTLVIVATANQGKLAEFIEILGEKRFRFSSLKEIGFTDEIIEDGGDFRANALIKCEAVARFVDASPERFSTPLWILSDDSGLLVDALDGAPGVETARFAGPQASDSDNISKLLQMLQQKKNRAARFVCNICLLIFREEEGWKEPLFFEGECSGTLTEKERGDSGFGYDPLFIPLGKKFTFAEISHKEKKFFSHRGKALQKLVQEFHLQ